MRTNFCSSTHAQSKALIGADVENVFDFSAPLPLASAPVGRLIDGATVTELPFFGASPSTVTALTDGRRRLEIEGTPPDGLTGAHGEAYIVTDTVCWACTILRYSQIDQTHWSAYLVDALPAQLPAGESCKLYYAYHYTVLPSRLTVTPVDDPLRFEVTYTALEQFGGGDESQIFYLRYVRQIFNTGLTAQELRTAWADFLPSSPTESSINAALSYSEDKLVALLRKELRETDLTEDDVMAPQSFRVCQRLYAYAHMLITTDQSKSDWLSKQAFYEFTDALARVNLPRAGHPLQADPQPIGKTKRDVQFNFGPPRGLRRWL